MMYQWILLLIAGVFSGAVIVWFLLKNLRTNSTQDYSQDIIKLNNDKQ